METVITVLTFISEHPFWSIFIVLVCIGTFMDDEDEEKDFWDDYLDGYITGIPTGGLGSWLGASEHWKEDEW